MLRSKSVHYRALLFSILSLFAGPSFAHDDWTTGDTVRQGILTGLFMVDWGQSRWIAKNCQPPVTVATDVLSPTGFASIMGPAPCVEKNKFLGAHPSVAQVNTYFSVSIVGHAAISYVLPKGWRETWQYVWIGAEASTVRKNYLMGVQFSW
jgi:hypothetical protein